MSYDNVDVLASFATERGITYPLLSDEGSRVIERLGLLNHQVAEQQAHFGKPVEEKHKGLPYPGTFILDEHGNVTDKQFEASHRVRASGSSLLTDLAGASAIGPAVADESEVDGVRLAAWLGSPQYRPLQVQRLQVRIDLPDGLHAYGEPVPPGYVPLRVRLGPPDEVSSLRPAPLPPARPFVMEGLAERFHVYTGQLVLDIPFVVQPDVGNVDLEVTLECQVCSDRLCHPPTSQMLRLALRPQP